MVRHAGVWVLTTSAVACLAVGCGKEKPQPAVAPTPQDVAFLTSDSAHISGTWLQVQNSRVAVICIPTVGFTRATWNNTVGLLASSGWSALSFDLRGEGESKRPSASTARWSTTDSSRAIERYVRDVRGAIRFVRSAVGSDVKVVLVGADIAGVAALYAATAEPQVRGVALITPPGGLDRLIAQGLVVRYGDRPLLIMTEQPLGATLGTARTTDSWLGRGSAITLRLSAPQEKAMLDDKQAALNKLLRWIDSATL